MIKIKKRLSICMAILFVMAGGFNNFIAKAATPSIPTIAYVGVSHSPLVVGDTEKFTVNSDYTGNVQYKAFLYSAKTNKWTALTTDYSVAVDAKTPYVLPETSAFELGKYKLSVWVKKAGTTGSVTTALGSYDSYYIANVNCVTKDPSNRVYANGEAKFDVTGLKFTFNTIQGIDGIPGPYSYRLHIYDPITNTWIKRVTEYKQAPSYTFGKAGTYMVVVHANTVKSTTWPSYLKEVKTIANQTSTYGTYEAWKTIMVSVKEVETVKIVDSTVKAAIFGSLVNVTMTAEGIKKYATVTNYQLFNGTSAISASTMLGTATTVFPRKVAGDKVTVKLIDAIGTVISTTEVVLTAFK